MYWEAALKGKMECSRRGIFLCLLLQSDDGKRWQSALLWESDNRKTDEKEGIIYENQEAFLCLHLPLLPPGLPLHPLAGSADPLYLVPFGRRTCLQAQQCVGQTVRKLAD